MKQCPATHQRNIINNKIEATIIAASNHSFTSYIEGGHFTVKEEVEDSDYVSILRDLSRSSDCDGASLLANLTERVNVSSTMTVPSSARKYMRISSLIL
jgi:hypothetical protein